MQENKFEKDSLRQIEELQESLLFGLFKFFKRGKVKKMLKKYENDPELQALTSDWNKQSQRLQKAIKSYKRKNKGKNLPWEKGYKFER